MKKITIVGRGVIGLASAFELARRGHKVDVVGPEETSGVASYAAVGISTIKGLRVARDDFFREKIAGHRSFLGLINQISRVSKLKIPAVLGVKECFADVNQYQKLRERIYHGEFTGCFKSEVHNLGQIRTSKALAAHLRQSSLLGAFYYPEDLWFHPRFFLESLDLAVRKLGGTIITEKVEKIALHPNGQFRLEGLKNQFSCDELVVACGASTPGLIKNLSSVKFPFVTVSGQTLVAPNFPRAQATFSVGRKGLSMYGSEIRYGSIDYAKNHIPNEQNLMTGKANLLNELRENFTLDFSSNEVISLWGVRLAIKDRRPVIGQLPCNGRGKLWISCGYHKSGYNFAGIAARTLANMIDGEHFESGQFYSVQRFLE